MRSIAYSCVVLALAAVSLPGCSGGSSNRSSGFDERSSYAKPKKEAWRGESEEACLASGRVRQSNFVTPRSALGGPSARFGGCGAVQPFQVSAADNGRIPLQPSATLRCPMVPAVDRWVRDVVSPAAIEQLGSPVTSIRVAASYACRPINHRSGNKLSEHGRANALDVSAFTLADGRVITVKRGWRGNAAETSFLRRVHRGGCQIFSTVLGPNADSYHHDHFHFDLARHGRTGTYRVCR